MMMIPIRFQSVASQVLAADMKFYKKGTQSLLTKLDVYLNAYNDFV
jgi:hypothetical protein